jgi:hypothetical protein
MPAAPDIGQAKWALAQGMIPSPSLVRLLLSLPNRRVVTNAARAWTVAKPIAFISIIDRCRSWCTLLT